ncbi:MAG: N-acetylmuramoyl-L-alanine amidase, partial [Pseudomonadota bacterium]
DALARLCDPAAEVSAHYLIAADGRIWAMVGESARAWHAGVSIWAGDRDVNSRAVGVELANPGGLAAPYEPFPEPQTARLETLLRALTRRWAIPPRRVLAHSDVAPGRKIDPGPKFDWRRLARAGLAAAPPPSPDGAPAAPAERAAFFAALGRIGYGDWAAEDLLWAFRARFRPEAAGRPINAGDLAIAAALEAAP